MNNRYFIYIKFDGSNYAGWQIQPNALSIQQVIEEKISLLLRQNIPITGAGRTDSGVHAKYMVAHFDTSVDELDKSGHFVYKMNKILPPDIAIIKIERVNNKAHARFDARWRTYHYTISKNKDPFLLKYAMTAQQPIDINFLNSCCEILKQHNDFQSFCKYHHGANTYICSIMNAQWVENDDFYIFTITADRFLRNMVRAIVGTLLDLNKKNKNTSDFESIILKKDRIFAGQSAEAKGLSLDWIEYSDLIYKL